MLGAFLPFFCFFLKRVERWDGGGRCGCTHARTGIFFCVTTTTLSFPLTPIDVTPTDLIALKAYSATEDGEND